MAPKTFITVSEVTGISDEEKADLNTASVDGKLEIYTLPGGNVVVPLFEENAGFTPFTHVMHGKVIVVI